MKKCQAYALIFAALLAPSTALATIAVAQEVVNPATLSGSSATTQTVSITPSSGSTLACGCIGVGTATTVTFTDSASGTWNTIKNVFNSPLVLGSGYRENVGSGALTVTATYNASDHHLGCKCTELTGGKTSSIIDGTPAGQFQLNVGTGTDAITSGNVTSSNQPALVWGICANYGNNKNPAAGTGFTSTRVDWATDLGGVRVEYKRVTATGTQAATYTGPSTDSWITHTAAFDEAAVGGSAPDGQGFFGQPGLAAGNDGARPLVMLPEDIEPAVRRLSWDDYARARRWRVTAGGLEPVGK